MGLFINFLRKQCLKLVLLPILADIEDMQPEEAPPLEAGDQPAAEQEVKITNAEERALEERLKNAEARANMAEEQLQRLTGDIIKMR